MSALKVWIEIERQIKISSNLNSDRNTFFLWLLLKFLRVCILEHAGVELAAVVLGGDSVGFDLVSQLCVECVGKHFLEVFGIRKTDLVD